MLAVTLLAACTNQATHSFTPPPTASGPPPGSAPASPAGPGTVPGASSSVATSARIADILATMNADAFNPQASPVKGATRPGGLFINWRGSWRGKGAGPL